MHRFASLPLLLLLACGGGGGDDTAPAETDTDADTDTDTDPSIEDTVGTWVGGEWVEEVDNCEIGEPDLR